MVVVGADGRIRTHPFVAVDPVGKQLGRFADEASRADLPTGSGLR